jgi:hypothetical protein
MSYLDNLVNNFSFETSGSWLTTRPFIPLSYTASGVVPDNPSGLVAMPFKQATITTEHPYRGDYCAVMKATSVSAVSVLPTALDFWMVTLTQPVALTQVVSLSAETSGVKNFDLSFYYRIQYPKNIYDYNKPANIRLYLHGYTTTAITASLSSIDSIIPAWVWSDVSSGYIDLPEQPYNSNTNWTYVTKTVTAVPSSIATMRLTMQLVVKPTYGEITESAREATLLYIDDVILVRKAT